MFDYSAIIDKYYPQGTALRDLYMEHCSNVARLARGIARRDELPIPPVTIEAAAMLHDIGICRCDAPSIGCHGSEPYLRHGVIGGDILRSEGAPEEYALVAERHTGSGLTPEDAERLGLPADRSYMPESRLERLICFADKFFSKSGARRPKTLGEARESFLRFGPESVQRFDNLAHEFFKTDPLPDIERYLF